VGFWEWADKHPIVLLLIAMFACSAIESCANAVFRWRFPR